MKKLTLEQKAKRYEYLEDILLEALDEKIENKESDETVANVVDKELNKLEDYIPHKMMFLFDRICDENFGTYVSMRNFVLNNKAVFDEYKQEYKQFEKKIGG